MIRFATTAAITCLALSACDRGQEAPELPAPGSIPPEQAAALFTEHCALCHGEKGDGHGPRRASLFRKPPDFRDPSWHADHTRRQIAATIRDGVPGSDMPAWGARLDDAEIAALADRVRAFGAERP